MSIVPHLISSSIPRAVQLRARARATHPARTQKHLRCWRSPPALGAAPSSSTPHKCAFAVAPKAWTELQVGHRKRALLRP